MLKPDAALVMPILSLRSHGLEVRVIARDPHSIPALFQCFSFLFLEKIENLKIVQCQHTQIGRREIRLKWGEDSMGQKISP